MTEMIFGLLLPDSPFPIAPELAHALAERVAAAAHVTRAGGRAAQAADLRRDAEHYLGARRRRALRLPASLERACDESARAVMRATVGVPPLPSQPDRMVA